MTVEEMRAVLRRGGELRLKLRVTPKCPETCWAGVMDDGALKLRLRAVPERGKANEELIRFLAHELGVSRAHVRITAGGTSQTKQVRITA